jgi:hypothetical protein
MKGVSAAPLKPHPMKEGQRPSFTLPPMEKGDGSLLPFPKPLSLSRAGKVMMAVTRPGTSRVGHHPMIGQTLP